MATRKKQGNGKEAPAAASMMQTPDAASASPTTTKRRATPAAKKAANSSSSPEIEKSSCADKTCVDSAAIAHRAWEIWQREGCPEGRAMEHWLQAERELAGS